MIDLEAEAYADDQATRCVELGKHLLLHVVIKDALNPRADKLERRMSRHLITAKYGGFRQRFEEICALAMTSPEWVRDAYTSGRLNWESYKAAMKARER